MKHIGNLIARDNQPEYIASLTSVGDSIYMRNYAHEFNAPLLTSVGGIINLYNYAHEFNAPLLASVGGYIDLSSYAHEFNAPLLTSVGGGIDLSCYAHEFNAPFLTKSGNFYTNRDMQINGIDTVSVDGFAMTGINWKSVDGVEVSSANYFKYPLDKKCFIAKSGDIYAHGETLKDAIDDLKFKIMEKMDKSEIVSEIKKTGIVTLIQWRALTGACRSGTAEKLGVSVADLPESMSIKDVLRHSAGTSFGKTFAEYLK